MNNHHESYEKFGSDDERKMMFDRLHSAMQVFRISYFMWEISPRYHPQFSKNNVPSLHYQLNKQHAILYPAKEIKKGI